MHLIICLYSFSCSTKKLHCASYKSLSYKEDLRKKSRDAKYTILILSYNSKFDLSNLKCYQDSILITKKIIQGNYNNSESDPKRITFELPKKEVNRFTVKFDGICYELLLKKEFDNYVIDYNLSKKDFEAIANNEEFLTFE